MGWQDEGEQQPGKVKETPVICNFLGNEPSFFFLDFFTYVYISGVQKKGTFSHFQHNQDYLEQKSFYSRKYRQSAISEPILVTFGGCQNCQNQTFNWPYQLYKSKYEKYFFVKRNTIMLFCMYQVFSSLLGHLHFFVHFSFTFMEHLFFWTPDITCNNNFVFFLIQQLRKITLQTALNDAIECYRVSKKKVFHKSEGKMHKKNENDLVES